VRTADLDEVIVQGAVAFSSPAAALLLEKGIPVVFLDYHGNYLGRLVSSTRQATPYASLRLLQYQVASDPARRLPLARAMVRGKIENMRVLLMRYARERASPLLSDNAARLQSLLERLTTADNLPSLLGLEGAASRLYFEALPEMLLPDLPFAQRRRHPPPDCVNALLGFAYALLSAALHSAVETAGLDPYLGFLHGVSDRRPALVLDLCEEFRACFADSLTLRAFNTRQITEADFDPTDRGPRLKESKREDFVRNFWKRLDSSVIHPMLGQSMTWRQVFLAQARAIRKCLEQPQTEYQPFLVR